MRWSIGLFLFASVSFATQFDQLTPEDRELLNICSDNPARNVEVNLWDQLEETGHDFSILPGDGGLEEGQVALTFDDGPAMPGSERIRQALNYCGIKAHFFVVGKSFTPTFARRFPETYAAKVQFVRNIHADGHAVGYHSMSHRHLATPEGWGNRATELDQVVDLIEGITGARSPFWRFPFGEGSWQFRGRRTRYTMRWLNYIHSRGMVDFNWNMSTGDSDRRHHRNATQVYQHTMSQLRMRAHRQDQELAHGILLAHDARRQTPGAIARILHDMMEQGYSFVTFRDQSRRID